MIALPSNPHVEGFILAAAMQQRAENFRLVEHLTVDDFSLEANRRLWRAITTVASQGPAEWQMVIGELEKFSQLASVGGITAISELMTAPNIVNIEFYARQLKEISLRRRVILMAHATTERLMADDHPASVAEEIAKFQNVEAVYKEGGDELSTIGEIIEEIGGLDGLLSMRDKPIPSPWPFVNDHMLAGGFRKGELVVIGARPSDGKTAMALQICDFAAASGFKPAFFSLETSREALIRRLLSSVSGIPLERIRRAMAGLYAYSVDERKQIMAAAGVLKATNLKINKRSSITVPQFVATVAKSIRGEGLDLAAVDFIQLLRVDERKQRHEALGQASRGFKLSVLEHKYCAIILSQLGRSNVNEDRPPRASDMKGSGGIEEDADVIISPYTPKILPGEQPRKEFHFLKQKDGPTGVLSVQFDPKTMRFYDCKFKEVAK